MNPATSIESIKGVGPRSADQFRAAGINTVGDLINFYPRRHEDFRQVATISEISPGKQTVKGRIDDVEIRTVRRGMTVTSATISDSTGKIKAIWFNQPYRKKQLESGEEFYFSGNYEFRYNRYQLTNPSAEKVSDMPLQTDRILPVYRSINGLKSQLVRKVLLKLKSLITMLPDTLPDTVRTSRGLISHSEALLGLHFPKTTEDIDAARHRIGFEELFSLILASRINRNVHQQQTGWPIKFDLNSTKEFVASLPFELTNDQRRAAWQIVKDFEKPTPMNRMLQGDVGSGKTVVAAIAALQAARAGYQTAIMAPTEILARQHAETLSAILSDQDIGVGLLIGAVKSRAREALLEAIKNDHVSIIVGTHALFQDKVKFSKLGFVVIDEQHRFGVSQRQKLLDKSDKLPHLLSMTATPIPRSLQLTAFGELDISVLAERPKNRLPIKTKLIAPTSRNSAYRQIDSEISAGRQAYVICSLINDEPSSDKKSVEAEYKKLKNSIFGHRRIALLHGKMKPEEKDQVMQDFKLKKFDILVSTTVVEVGVDVPNATAIMIEDASNFGLAQLHQLRGRVGRSSLQSYCYLMLSDSKPPTQRLKEIEKSNDGFYLAEVDLQLRGPGEIYGRAQHGELNLSIAKLADTKLVNEVQQAAEDFLASGEDLLQYSQLSSQVAHYQRLTTLN